MNNPTTEPPGPAAAYVIDHDRLARAVAHYIREGDYFGDRPFDGHPDYDDNAWRAELLCTLLDQCAADDVLTTSTGHPVSLYAIEDDPEHAPDLHGTYRFTIQLRDHEDTILAAHTYTDDTTTPASEYPDADHASPLPDPPGPPPLQRLTTDIIHTLNHILTTLTTTQTHTTTTQSTTDQQALLTDYDTIATRLRELGETNLAHTTLTLRQAHATHIDTRS
ncbi:MULTISPECIES: hypothetical protein [unclassified Nocardia]|uniref:hypothetical protein n=1 Tax=unclassified Nocardia TaxID=2637762 RepID=UPI001CE4104A|nr:MULTISPECIES: hypothetical protein [unclassified Nocardia]